MVLVDMGILGWLLPTMAIVTFAIALILDEPAIAVLSGFLFIATALMLFIITGYICLDICPATTANELFIGLLISIGTLGLGISVLIAGAVGAFR